ncbi:IS5 family transposase [Endozoicomonas sp. ALB115]|uniref:IS5 family transposase n=1 Tax=Endozoicomonas sp. ALB115 TaxID=3403074 RepID=UPI003BB4B369
MYPSDLTDDEWAILKPLFPDPGYDTPKNRRPRDWSYRLILNVIFYLTKTGCQWRMLPSDFPPWSTVYTYFRIWKQDGTWKKVHDALRDQVRIQAGKEPQPTAASIDSQSVKTSGKRGDRGYDGGKKIKGRKRHIAVDTLGLILVVWVHAAAFSDSFAGQFILAHLKKYFKNIGKVWADCGYRGYLEEWFYRFKPKRELEITKRPRGKFVVQARRWVVERTFGWFEGSRRLSKDYEQLPRSSEAFVYICMIRIMLRRLK